MYNIDFSLTNGLGKPSISVYYSGCDIPVKCKECHNPELWVNQDAKMGYDELFKKVNWYQEFNHSKELIVSFVGGDPLAPYNRNSLMSVANKLKLDFPNIKLVLYSWRKPDEIEEEWVKDIDFGVLGQFDIGEYKESYLPASNNQFIYDFKTGKVLEPVKLK